jgi:hypothetical protein
VYNTDSDKELDIIRRFHLGDFFLDVFQLQGMVDRVLISAHAQELDVVLVLNKVGTSDVRFRWGLERWVRHLYL